MTKRAGIRLFLCVVVPTAIFAQPIQPQPKFEVVSIKPLEHAKPAQATMQRGDPARVSYPSVNLMFLIVRAYGVRRYQMSYPAWIETQFYDVLAKIPDGATQEQVPVMLQTMLAERFGLKVHWESQIQPAYALLVDKKGPKLRKSDEPAEAIGPNAKPAPVISFSTSGHLEFRRRTVSQFAQSLSVDLGRPVLDLTDIEGTFDIVMDVNPADLYGLQGFVASVNAPPQESSLPSIFTAIQALGLRLEPQKAPIQRLIVDSALKIPTEN